MKLTLLPIATLLATLAPIGTANAQEAGNSPPVFTITEFRCSGNGKFLITVRAEDPDENMTGFNVSITHFTPGGPFPQVNTLLTSQTFQPRGSKQFSREIDCDPGDEYELRASARDNGGEITPYRSPITLCNTPASIVSDNPGGTNPSSFTAAGTNPDSSPNGGQPVIGGTVTWDINASGTTGHTASTLLGYLSGATTTLNGGQVLLMNVGDPAGAILQFPVTAGDFSLSAPVPNDPSLCGIAVYAQGVHLLGVQPFALTNRHILTVGF